MPKQWNLAYFPLKTALSLPYCTPLRGAAAMCGQPTTGARSSDRSILPEISGSQIPRDGGSNEFSAEVSAHVSFPAPPRTIYAAVQEVAGERIGLETYVVCVQTNAAPTAAANRLCCLRAGRNSNHRRCRQGQLGWGRGGPESCRQEPRSRKLLTVRQTATACSDTVGDANAHRTVGVDSHSSTRENVRLNQTVSRFLTWGCLAVLGCHQVLVNLM
jgi:hypothetical protein